LVKNEASINEEIEPEMVIQRLRAEVKRLREEVAFLQGKQADNDSDGEEESYNLPQHEMNELTEAVTKYVQDFDERSQLDFCGGITLPKIKAVCSIFKSMLLSNVTRGTNIINKSNGSDVDDSSDEQGAIDTSANHKAKLKQKRNPMHKVRTVCGVPVCNDEQVLDEPNAAFTWFKDRYPGSSALEDHKSVLKAKYSEVSNALLHTIIFTFLMQHLVCLLVHRQKMVVSG
jgi:kinesin family protein 6/9